MRRGGSLHAAGRKLRIERPDFHVFQNFSRAYVCAARGYLEFYVQNEEKLKQIPEMFKKVN
jgi:hypothetical protein